MMDAEEVSETLGFCSELTRPISLDSINKNVGFHGYGGYGIKM
jgi:hypothetical protein